MHHLEPDEFVRCDAVAFSAYLEALRACGWEGDGRLARLGYAASAALRYGIYPTWGRAVDDEGRPVEEIGGRPPREFLERRALIMAFLCDLADEARSLIDAVSIGNRPDRTAGGMSQPMGPAPADSLWKNRAFLRLWLAQIVSNAGTAITRIALPLAAVLVLHATPGQMALPLLAGQLPNLLFGLLAGVWVDRRRRRPLLIGADLGRALLLGSIPAAALLGHLTLAQLCVVSFLSATLSLVYQLANVALLPSLVSRSQLIEANGRLSVSNSILAIGGPGMAGALVQVLSAPKAIVVDAVSYLLSAASLAGIRVPEGDRSVAKRPALWRDAIVGLRELVRTPVLLALSVATAISILGGNVQGTVQLLFLVNVLHFSPAVLGLLAAADGAAAVLGGLFAGRAARRLGIGPVILLGCSVYEVARVLIPLAGLSETMTPIVIVTTASILTGLSYTVYEINQVSLRQALTPPDRLGRTTGARRVLIFCAAPLGAALGGYLGTTVGLRPTLIVGAIVSIISCVFLIASPIREVRELPAVAPT